MYPGNTRGGQLDETQTLRIKQIDSLRQYFSTIKEITRESQYDAILTLPSRKTITLRINLPKDFPKVGPTLQIFPPVQHRFVDQQMFIIPQAHENLGKWTLQASLGKTIFEIVQKLMQDPPQILSTPPPQQMPPQQLPPQQIPQQGYPNQYPVATQSSMGIPNKPPPPYQSPSPSLTNSQKSAQPIGTHTPLPVIPSSFPEIEARTPSELSQMLNDEVEFNKFFDDLNVVQTMKKVRDDLRNANEEFARKSLARESEIESLRREIDTRNRAVSEKRSTFEQKAQRQQEVMKQFSTPTLIDQLSTSAADAETASDAIANKFLAGEMDFKDFIKEFMDKRKLFHLRAAKKESLMMMTR